MFTETIALLLILPFNSASVLFFVKNAIFFFVLLYWSEIYALMNSSLTYMYYIWCWVFDSTFFNSRTQQWHTFCMYMLCICDCVLLFVRLSFTFFYVVFGFLNRQTFFYFIKNSYFMDRSTSFNLFLIIFSKFLFSNFVAPTTKSLKLNKTTLNHLLIVSKFDSMLFFDLFIICI